MNIKVLGGARNNTWQPQPVDEGTLQSVVMIIIRIRIIIIIIIAAIVIPIIVILVIAMICDGQTVQLDVPHIFASCSRRRKRHMRIGR